MRGLQPLGRCSLPAYVYSPQHSRKAETDHFAQCTVAKSFFSFRLSVHLFTLFEASLPPKPLIQRKESFPKIEACFRRLWRAIGAIRGAERSKTK